MARKPAHKQYYYAGGKQIRLKGSEDVIAIPKEELAQYTKLHPDIDIINSQAAKALPRADVVLVDTSQYPAGAREYFIKKGDNKHPVFETPDGLMVALPEIRVEVDNNTQSELVEATLANIPGLNVERKRGRYVISIPSGDATKAMEVANAIYEHAKPGMSQARFVKVIKHPDPSRSRDNRPTM